MRIVDLFSGAGGLTFGFYYSLVNNQFIRNNDCEIVFANEKDPNAAKAFSLNFPDVKMVNCDISILNRKIVSNLIGQSEIDLIIGGPPCQSFTTIGRRKYDDRAKLYEQYIRLLSIIRPRIFIFENVKGILSMKDDAGFSVMEKIVANFKEINTDLGYQVKYKTLDAVNFNVPQFRERVFIIGIRKDQNIEWNFVDGNDSKLSIREAISDLPPVKQGKSSDYYQKNTSNYYQNIMRGNNEKLTFHYAAHHNDKINTVIRNVTQGEGRAAFNNLIKEGIIDKKYFLTSGYENTYARLIGSQPSTTITHNMSTPSSLRCIHYSQNRALTPREGARIQSCPDWFQFYGSLTDIKTQIGNAVPPLLAMALKEMSFLALK